MSKRPILVTGAAGFVGSALVEQLLARGNTVVGLDSFHPYYSPERKRKNVHGFEREGRFRLCEADFTDRDVVQALFREHHFESVAHLGAMANVRYSVKHPAEFALVNVSGTSHLLEASCEFGVKNFVFASTSSVYGQREDVPFSETDRTDGPLAPYPATKKAGELLGHAFHNMHGLSFTALRFFNVYGPRGRPDMMPYIVAERLLREETITLFDGGEMYRDWTFVNDVVAGVIAALDTPLGFECLNIGRGEPILMKEFMAIAQEIVGKEARIEEVPAPASEPKQTYASIEKAQQLLGYQPTTSLREGYELFWNWYQSNVL